MKVKELLYKEAKWTQRTRARTFFGHYRCEPRSILARQWCLTGAIEKCYPYANPSELSEICDRIRKHLPRGRSSLVQWNDQEDTTFADVQALLEKADV